MAKQKRKITKKRNTHVKKRKAPKPRSRKTKKSKRVATKVRHKVSRNVQKPTKRKSRKKIQRRASGSGTKKEVFSSVLNKNVILIKKFSNFKTRFSIYDNPNEIIEYMRPIVRRHFNKIKPSYKDLWLFSIKYSFEIEGSDRSQYFSLSISKLKTFENLMHIVESTVLAFLETAINEYSKNFLDILIDGLKLQGYKKA